MAGEKKLETLLKTMKPQHISGESVFCVVDDIKNIAFDEIFLIFKEQ